MRNELQHAVEMGHLQRDRRTEWRTQSNETMAELLFGEAQELVDAFHQFGVVRDAEMNFVGEIGDVIYLTTGLAHRYNQDYLPDEEDFYNLVDPEILIYQIRDQAQYLHEDFDITNVPHRLEVILSLTFELCDVMGIQPEHALQYKLIRNAQKYQDYMMSNGWDEETARRLAKSLFRSQGGDHPLNLWMQENFPLDQDELWKQDWYDEVEKGKEFVNL